MTSRGDILVTVKFQNIILAFSGLIVYSALCTVCGFIFSEPIHGKIVSCVLTAALGGLYIKTVIKYPTVWGDLPKSCLLAALLTVIVFAFTSMQTSSFVLTYINDEAFFAAEHIKEESSVSMQVLSVIVSCTLVPVTEEIIFRGLMYRQLAQLNKCFSIIFTSVLFAVWHGTLIHLYVGFLGGLVFACIYEKTQMLRYCVLAHALFNFISFIASIIVYPEWFFSVYVTIFMNLLCLGLIVKLFLTNGIKPLQRKKQ